MALAALETVHIDGVYGEDRDSGGTITATREYYAAGGAMRVNGTLYFVMGDNLGSAVLTLDSSGNTVGHSLRSRYFPFGSVRFASGTMQTDRLYTGQRNVASLGLMDYHARFYDPGINRFVSPDSVIPGYANPQSLDRYSYVLNSPIDISDPSGMKPCWATHKFSCDLRKWTKSQADAQVAQYSLKDRAAVVAFFQSHGVPVSSLSQKNSRGLLQGAASTDTQVDFTTGALGAGKPLFDIAPPPAGERLLVGIIAAPIAFILDQTSIGITQANTEALMVAPLPAKPVFLVSEIVIGGVDILAGYAHISVLHWVVTGEMLTPSNWTDWRSRP